MTIEELAAMAAQYALSTMNQHAVRLRIYLADGRKFDHPISPNILLPGSASALAAAVEHVPGVDVEVIEAILNRLADTCKRHTRDEMSLALEESGYSESAVQKALWQMRKAGKLTNGKDGYGTGFGLVEWK